MAAFAAQLPLPALGNCIPPWKTFFACNIAGTNARAEFCKIDDKANHPARKEGYYTFARGAKPAELHFETDAIVESFKENEFSPTKAISAFGYVRGAYVYSFFATEDRRGGFPHAEIRVYKSLETFMSKAKNNETERLVCDPTTIVTLPSFLGP